MISTPRSLSLRPPVGGRLLLGVALAAALLLGPALPAPAVELDLTPTPVDQLPDPELDVRAGAIRLSLDDAISVALRRNLGLVIERYNWVQQRERVMGSLGIYDLLLFGGGSYRDQTQPTVEVTEGVPVIQSTSKSYQLSLRQLVPTGGVAEWTTSAFTTETNSENVFVNPQYSARTDLTFTQPLLRGFGRLETERRIMVAKAEASRSRELVEQQVAFTLQDVEEAYWDLVEARNQLEVAEQALELATTLHEQNRVRVEVGTLAPLELVQSQAGIANREEDIIIAEAAIGDAADRLRQLLNLDRGRLWELEIVPVTDPESERITIDLERAIDTAIEERPEIDAEHARLEVLEIDARFLKDQVLPQLDLVVNYNLAGLSGDTAPIVDPETGEEILGQSGSFGDAFQQIYDADFDAWSVQFNVSYPLQNRDRRAQRLIAELAVDQGLASLEQLRSRVVTEVRTAARAVETAAKQIESARVSRELEEQNLDAERKRYENGMSSSFRVLEIQEDLTQARSREVRAVTAYRTALARYYRTIGRLLEQKGVELEAGPPAYPGRFGFGGGMIARGEGARGGSAGR